MGRISQRIGTAAAVGVAALVVTTTLLGAGITASARTVGTGTSAKTSTFAAPAAAPAVAPLAKPLVILYGDSLAWEAEDAFVAAFAGRPDVQVLTRTYGGTAICDWFDEMQADAAALAPGAVVLEFTGNTFTPCVQDARGHGLVDEAAWAKYRADAQTAIDIFAPTNTRVFLAGSPISRAQEVTGDYHGGVINAMYREIAEQHDGVEYVDAGAAVLDHGHWTPALPCLPAEPCTGGTDLLDRGVNVVRAPDGGHFCPAAEESKRGVVDACPVWSSGAYRYGNAMAAPVLAALPR